jgi:TM2 domain-containing membrane protein YozV
MTLTSQDRMLIEQRVTNDAKSAGIAYAFWFFTGYLGGHRFYLGKTGTAVAQLVLCILGVLTAVFGVGVFMMAIVVIWVLIDAFLIPGMIKKNRDNLRKKLVSDPEMRS